MKTFIEKLHPDYSQVFKIKSIIAKKNSNYQKILIFDNEKFGRILALDNIVQITEKDHHAYTEMLVHFPIISNDNIKKVLIIGGGDGAIAYEVLKHKQIEEITLCEIDELVINLSKKFLKKINFNALNNSKVKIVIEDASKYTRNDLIKEYFDLVIIDRPDPKGPGKALFKNDFYKNINNTLSKNGIVVLQSGIPFFQKEVLKKTFKKLNELFKYNGIYCTIVPSYVGGHMALSWASNSRDLSKKINTKNSFENLKKISTKYYSSEIHNSSLLLPIWIKKIL